MGKDLENLVTTTHVAEVVHHGEKLIVPEGMGITDAITTLKRRREYLNSEVELNETFDVFPWDGAYALAQVLRERYGWVEGVPLRGFFGDTKPQVIKVAIDVGEVCEVPWGNFELPQIDGMVSCGTNKNRNGCIVFALSAVVRRVDEQVIRDLFDEMRTYLRSHSIYRGKAIKLRFRDSDGERMPLPEPEFIDVSKTDPNGLIYSDDLMASVEANLFTPITRVQDCLDNGIKVKRGVLLGGAYGTGKTLAASVAARLAVDNGITYIYTPRAEELGDAIDFARQYQSPACVVFCEDIDRHVTGDRSVKMDDILNILDGVDTKGDNLITVLTTNHLENINKAMLRPGRLDAIINVTAPDAKAAEKLVRLYGGHSIAPEEDLTTVGATLKGQIPAVIEETVKRAKLFQLAINGPGEPVTGLTGEALRQAGATMTTQIELLAEKKPEVDHTVDAALGKVIRRSLNGATEADTAAH